MPPPQCRVSSAPIFVVCLMNDLCSRDLRRLITTNPDTYYRVRLGLTRLGLSSAENTHCSLASPGFWAAVDWVFLVPPSDCRPRQYITAATTTTSTSTSSGQCLYQRVEMGVIRGLLRRQLPRRHDDLSNLQHTHKTIEYRACEQTGVLKCQS